MSQSETIKQAIEKIRESVATLDGLRGWITSRNACEALFMESRDLGKVADDLEKMLAVSEHLNDFVSGEKELNDTPVDYSDCVNVWELMREIAKKEGRTE
jgi:hypothetical protein